MSIKQQQLSDNTWMVSVQGRLDQEQTPLLEQHLTSLLEADVCRFLVNLGETTYINSGGLRCLVSAWRQARQKEGILVLSGLSTRLQEIFAMVGFDKVFRIYDNAEAAQHALLDS